MSRGYTPVFQSVFDGTLCGKWPDSGIWLCFLALADSAGVIDMTPEAISARVGIPVDDLLPIIERLCLPDPRSRSKVEDGRRLMHLDPERSWGWRITNHARYRERARELQRSVDGRNAKKVSDWREKKRAEQESTTTEKNSNKPDVTRCNPEVTSSNPTQTQTQTKEKNTPQSPRKRRARFDPKSVELPTWLSRDLWIEWCENRAQQRKPITQPATKQQLADLQRWHDDGLDAERSIRNAISSGWQGLFEPKPSRTAPPDHAGTLEHGEYC